MKYITTVIVSTAIIIVLFYIIEYLLNKFREYNMVKRFSGPKAYPIIGNLNLFFGSIEDITNTLIKVSTNYPSPQRFWIGSQLTIMVDDPKHMRILLKSSYSYEKNQIYDFIKSELGDGLLTAPALKWKIHRKILNPVFKKGILSTYMDSIIKNSNRLATILDNTNGINVDIGHYVNLCTLDIIFDSFLSCDLDLQNNPECKLDEYMSESMDIIMKRTYHFWLHLDIIFYNSYLGKRLKELVSHIDKITSEIIKKTKESMEENRVTEELQELDANKGKNTSIFLDLLFKSFYETKEYSEKDIRDEIKTIIVAGSTTTAETLAFLFLMVATFPEVQQQIYEELYQMYGSSDPEDILITLEDIKEMKYLERVIRETLRLFPPAAFIGRKISEDIEVDENVTIPKNSSVLFSIFTYFRMEKYWKQPLTFNPDRFLQNNYNPKYFLPFSTGKRDCIGQIFAMNEMKTIVATVLRKFIVQIDNPIAIEDIPIKVGLTLKPAAPILLKFNKR